MSQDNEYKVGYRKPPKESQFQKGKSGNSSGRPKRDPGIAAVFRKVSKQKVTVNGRSGQQFITKLEASMTQLANKAASGDLKALKILLEMASRFPELVTDPEPSIVLEIHPI
jgi:Family of unknown function (DUF5681)